MDEIQKSMMSHAGERSSGNVPSVTQFASGGSNRKSGSIQENVKDVYLVSNSWLRFVLIIAVVTVIAVVFGLDALLEGLLPSNPSITSNSASGSHPCIGCTINYGACSPDDDVSVVSFAINETGYLPPGLRYDTNDIIDVQ